ncbi:shikimate dehydrogenase [Williamsia limnetica]|uniref:Shikimate dehydrogenase n=1 Tax=Williamsia limnetica TaxID=882452 RepID=A0A318RQU5_WILLI|nr:shikimate 5-dehydrogenase [Williamsia limnetica]PYE20616.1 shikimate dehydrogenase [Williamsia limnetica]
MTSTTAGAGAPDARVLRRDTQLCISLSGRPSNIGTKFHNYLYNELGIDFVYKAFSTADLPAAVAGIRALGIRGAGISMPFKEDVIELVDVMHDSAAAIDSVNTIVNEDGILHAYNTDYQAAANLLRERALPRDYSVVVSGSGGMAKAVVAALRDEGYTDTAVIARNEQTGRALAERYGFTWQPELGAARPDLLVNTTPVGMAGGPDADGLPFPPAAIDEAKAAFDVVAMPARTPLISAFDGRPVITGAQVIALQAAEQFVLYTGVRPSDAQITAASEFSRS